MAQDLSEGFVGERRGNWVRLRTLVILRWFAVAGQAAAVLVAIYLLDLSLPVGLISVTIGVLALANVISTFLYPENRRLTGREVILMMAFDLIQLAVLLYLTGGLNNPFAVLFLAPVTISATMLSARRTVLLGGLAIVLISVLSLQSLPLLDQDGNVLTLPGLFVFGFWSSLVIGIVFIGFYARRVTEEMVSMGEALSATQMALAREQKLTDLGGVVAAAAHELGTPLATIKLVSGELAEEFADRPDLAEDIQLIREQADRCRDILRSMGRAGKDDKHLRRAPLETVIREAAEPHLDRGAEVRFCLPDDVAAAGQPIIERRPEIIHGLRNLIQNAVDFCRTAVLVEILWTDDRITIQINDDGEGFPASVLGRIGDPFVRRRRWALSDVRRPAYEGMGLGLFIAKTLLERSGATLDFANGGARAITGQPGGASVEVAWPRDLLEVSHQDGTDALGENERII